VSDTSPPLSLYVGQIQARSPRSRRVDVIAGYFRFTAVASAVGLVGKLALAAMHWSPFWSAVVAHPLAMHSGRSTSRRGGGPDS
jgi:hypothetical protein